VGIGILVYCFWRFFKRTSTEWVLLLKERAIQKSALGVIVFLIIGTVSAFIPSIVEILSMIELMRSNNYSQYLTSLLASYIVMFVLFFWLGTRFKFIPIKEAEREVT
jgi:predicted cation transporter